MVVGALEGCEGFVEVEGGGGGAFGGAGVEGGGCGEGVVSEVLWRVGQEEETFGVFFKFGCFGHGADGGGNFLCGQIGVYGGKRPPSYTLEEFIFKGNRILFVEMANRDVCRQSKFRLHT